jgi:integrase
VNAYKAQLEGAGRSASTINSRLCALRKLVWEAADNGLLPPDLAAAIARVRGVGRRGVRLGNWLDRSQAERLIQMPDISTLAGKRDRALLAILIGCGLRRSEAVGLTFAHIQRREGRWAIVDLLGKHGRIRSIPMPEWAKTAVDRWATAASIDSGRVFRPINRGGRLTHASLTDKCIWFILRKYAPALGLANLAPHDLRRSFAKLAHQGKAPIEQIQISLGHASIQTTERYLGVQQDLGDAPCDHLGLQLNTKPYEGKRAA